MRIHLKIYSGNKTIPFKHQHLLVGTVHKWLGWNDLHGRTSLFSFSRLQKGESTKIGLKLGEYCSFFISAYNDEVIKTIIKGIQKDTEMFEGLHVSEIIIQENPDFSNTERFLLASPVLIKRREKERTHEKHYTFNDENVDNLLKETMQTKMKVAGVEDDTFEMYFDKEYARPTIKLIDYKGIGNRVNWCPVIIKGKPETKLFAWNVGIGNSTGIGFGAIK